MQHPLEVHHAKGSARLLHLCLPNSMLIIGEVFSEPVLHDLLHAPFQSARRHVDGPDDNKRRQPVLLYPESPDDHSTGILKAPSLAPDLLENPSQVRLVVLDGTWRKSRKQLYLNPQLQQLPRLPLRDLPSSHYVIRKAHRPDQLSSFEATCHALLQLCGNAETIQPLFTAFDGFVAQQLDYVGDTSGRRDATD